MRTVEINDRAILVIDPEPDTAVSLRDRISTRRAIVRRTEASGAEDQIRTLKPHPFAVVGVTRGSEPPVLSPAVLGVLASEPIPVVWRGTPPKGLPSNAVLTDGFSAFRDSVVALVGRTAGRVSLADHRGVEADGLNIACPQLEGLIAGGDVEWTGPAARLRSAKSAIARHHLPLEIVRPRPGVARLEPTPQ